MPRWISAVIAAGLILLPTGSALADEALQPDPAAEEAFFEGNGKLAEGKPLEALAEYDRALQIQPSLYRVHLYRGRALLLLGRFDEAEEAARSYGAASTTEAEISEFEELAQRIAEARDDTPQSSSTSAPPRGTGQRPRLWLGVTGGYAHSKRDLDHDWGLLGIRADVRIVSGLHARLCASLGMQAEDGRLYGIVPVELGVTWRFGTGAAVPYVDGHAMLLMYDDAKDASGATVTWDPPGTGFGGGVGGGVEFSLARGARAGLSVAPDVRIGWAGAVFFAAGVSVRVSLGP